MIPRLDIQFPFRRQYTFWFGKEYKPSKDEYLLNYARSGIVLALCSCFPNGANVGIVTYNCHTVANAVVSAGCTPVFLDIDDNLHIDLNRGAGQFCKNEDLDAIIVTNLFGIHNDISALRQVFSKAIIIVDNAHGYGLTPEGDFTVYSINQGKYPALGPGGIMVCCTPYSQTIIKNATGGKLAMIGLAGQFKIYCTMLLKAFLYHPLIYGWLTIRIKKESNNRADHSLIRPRVMCPGVSRLYNAWLEEHKDENVVKPFMDIIKTDEPEKVIQEYRNKGIEADTHFKNCINWAKEFGYIEGTCPNSEILVTKLVMVPNYYL